MSDATRDRRQYPRVPSENAVLIRRLETRDQQGKAVTRQLGLGGCMVSSSEPLGVDQYVQLRISIDDEHVDATGRVIWEQPTENGRVDAGIAFVAIDTAHLERISRLLEPVADEA